MFPCSINTDRTDSSSPNNNREAKSESGYPRIVSKGQQKRLLPKEEPLADSMAGNPIRRTQISVSTVLAQGLLP